METVISEKALRTGFGFIPMESLRRFAGNFPVVPAQHKLDSSHFIVEELQREGLLTATPKSDFTEEQLNATRGGLVAFSLVKERLTTSAAVDLVAAELGINPRDITVAANKDRTARSCQKAVIVNRGIGFDHVLRHSTPDDRLLRERGWYIKDVRRHDRPLRKGFLEGNAFTLRISIPGMNKSEIEEYLRVRLDALSGREGFADDVVTMPNFYGRQRLGRRQNLLGVGYEFITKGPEAGVKRFCCELVEENDHPLANDLRRKLAVIWAQAEETAAAKGQTVAEQSFDFIEMQRVLEEPEPGYNHRYRRRPSYEPANMFIEHKLISKIIETRSIERAFLEMRDDVSLWVGAYQGYWFNQALARVLDGLIPIEALEADRRTGEPVIPLYFAGDENSVKWYERWLPEAIPSKIDPVVRKYFLTNTDGSSGPRRPSHVRVGNLDVTARDESINLTFTLRRGSYATTFLSLLFNLDGKDWEVLDK